jgi:hypothetical protein
VISIDGVCDNQNYDLDITPRPESHREDFELAKDLKYTEAKEKLWIMFP